MEEKREHTIDSHLKSHQLEDLNLAMERLLETTARISPEPEFCPLCHVPVGPSVKLHYGGTRRTPSPAYQIQQVGAEHLLWGRPEVRQQESEKSEEIGYIRDEYLKLLSRQGMLLALLGKDELSAKLDKYFPHVTNMQTWILRFEVDGVASATDYSRFFGGLDRLHRLLVTFAKKEYFATRWLRGKIPELLDEDKLNILTIKKESPGEIRGTATEACVAGLKDVLSVGKQIEDIRMSGVRVADAKLELERKQREMDEAEKKREVQDELSHLDADIEREKKLLEIEQLRTQRDQELHKRRVMQQEDFIDRFARLAKTLKILAELPEEVKRDVKGAFQAELEELRSLPITIKSLDLIAEDTSQS